MKIQKGLAVALGAAIVLAFLLILSFGASSATAEEEPAGKTLFEATYKCNMCHAVPAAGIEAKSKSESMKGKDLGGKVEGDLATIAAYLRKESDVDGKQHKKEFKGTDEELQTIVDWLGSLEAPE